MNEPIAFLSKRRKRQGQRFKPRVNILGDTHLSSPIQSKVAAAWLATESLEMQPMVTLSSTKEVRCLCQARECMAAHGFNNCLKTSATVNSSIRITYCNNLSNIQLVKNLVIHI
jgi:hypothetical protein